MVKKAQAAVQKTAKIASRARSLPSSSLTLNLELPEVDARQPSCRKEVLLLPAFAIELLGIDVA